jgi:hypothetical protein
MSRKALVLTLITATLLLFSLSSVSAQTIDDVSDPGILPDSPFYFLQDWWQDVRLFFTTNPTAKAELNLKYASQDVLAYQQLAQTANQELLDKIMNRYQNRIKEANNWMSQAKEQGSDISKTANKLKDSTKKQVEVLAAVYNQAPETARKGLKTVIENTSKEVASSLEAAVGSTESLDFSQSLNQAINNMGLDSKLQIQEKSQNENSGSNNINSGNLESNQGSDTGGADNSVKGNNNPDNSNSTNSKSER